MSLGISLSRRGDQIDRRRVRRFVKAHGRNHQPVRTEETFLAETLGRGRSVLWIPRRFRFQERSGHQMQTTLREKPRQTFHVPALRRDAMEQQQCRTRHQNVCEASGRYRWNVQKKGVNEYLTLLVHSLIMIPIV
jgi:hypothetical protein